MNTTSSAEEKKGVIAQRHEDGLPVIYKFVEEMPSTTVRSSLQWLTVISWKYDGSSNNGMPVTDNNQEMIELEKTIREIENGNLLRHVYSRTGNNLKELVYYIHGQEEFLVAFNKALIDHSRYPIKIEFFEDKEWKDFQRTLQCLKKNG